MSAVHLPLFWVGITAEHRSGLGDKRFVSVPVRARHWVDAGESEAVSEAETRLLEGEHAVDWVVELRIYQGGKGGGEGLPLFFDRRDGGAA